jgi:hypothetical protein
MADIISALEASPPKAKTRRLPPGIHDGRLIGRDGVAYDLLQSEVAPEQATTLAGAGADVVFDECGCGGTCGLRWVAADEAKHLAGSLPALRYHKGQTGALSLWESESGHRVVLAQGPVAWDA